MKYTFNISKNTTNNTTKSNNTKSNNNELLNALLDADLLSRINNMSDYIFEKKSPEISTYSYNKKRTIDINIDINTPKKTKSIKPDFDTFCKAFSYLMSSDSYDTYDFKLDDGTPIKLFADEIQIGYELIPLNGGSKRIYDMLSDSKKKEIIDIYIDITK